jgi:hypothetical protein
MIVFPTTELRPPRRERAGVLPAICAKRSDPTLVLHADAMMVVEGHVVARALALFTSLASLFGLKMNIQVVVLFQVTAILAVLRKHSHFLFLPTDGCSFPTVLSSVRFGHHRPQRLSPCDRRIKSFRAGPHRAVEPRVGSSETRNVEAEGPCRDRRKDEPQAAREVTCGPACVVAIFPRKRPAPGVARGLT